MPKPKPVVLEGVNESVWCEMDNASPGVIEEQEARASPADQYNVWTCALERAHQVRNV